MNTSTAGQALAEAIAMEHYNARRYAGWSIRMRPYDSEASALLKSLAEEERKHEQELQSLYDQKFSEPLEEVAPDSLISGIELERYIGDRHFFVVDAPMAVRILASALEVETSTQAFYARLSTETTDPKLREVYTSLAEFEGAHVELLDGRLREHRAAL